MAIYMKYGAIQGATTTDGFKGWIQLNSFTWGVGRAIGTAARGSTSRESSEPSLGEIVVTKMMDVASPQLLLDAVAGKLDNQVTLKFTTTGSGSVTTFLTYELANTGISSYNLNSEGDMPVESLSLNFTKIIETFAGLGPSITGQPQSVGYNLADMVKA